MLDDLLKFYISEGVDKQVLKKIPYFLMVSLLIYLALAGTGLKLSVDALFIVTPLVCVVVFIVSTAFFLNTVNAGLAGAFKDLDFKKMIAKFSSVYEGQNSLLDDINLRKGIPIAISAILNGVSLLILMVTAFLALVVYSGVGIPVLAAATVFGIIYVVIDVSKSSVVEEPENKADNPLAFDFLEQYAVKNTLRRMPRPLRFKGFVYIASRLIGPLFHVEFPKLLYDTMLVYDSEELEDLFRQMNEKEKERGFYLKRDGGDSIDQLFKDNPVHRITALSEYSPIKLFPYMFDPKYSEPDKPGNKGWGSFAVVDISEHTVGHVFIHGFRSVLVRTLVKTERPRRLPIKNVAYQFILVGERSYLQYIKTKIELHSARVPPDVLRVEFEP